MREHSKVLILDFGSQYTQLIARRVRELGVYSFIKPGSTSLEEILKFSPAAIILSGGPSSVYEEGAPQLPVGFLEFQKKAGLPLLGICYGMQLLVKDLGGVVEKASLREYGRMEITPSKDTELFQYNQFKKIKVWMSHGDETKKIPPGFSTSALSSSGGVAAVENPQGKIWGLQFHPEVTHTESGSELLHDFLFRISGLKPDWNMASVKDDALVQIRERVGPTAHVMCALSGGVDSAVAAVLVHQAIGDRLHCVFVDHGFLRFEEQTRVMNLFRDHLHLPVECVDASQQFLSKLRGVTDPEQKRKIIGAEFISVFESVAQKFSTLMGHLPEFLVQGTLYPDVIESTLIKSHHNVGGLPKDLRFKLIEPLRNLFKDEVRKLGKELGVPDQFLKRHPFPGPGLAVRIIGEVTKERLEILRLVDEIFIESLLQSGIYDSIWQAFAVFLPIKSVGVQGDGRTHDHVVALRAVTSLDGMTADWFQFEPKFLASVSSRICNEVRGVNRVVYDISSKPPATIEWE